MSFWQLTVRSLTGLCYRIQVSSAATVLDAKKAIQEKDSNLLPHFQRLIGPRRTELSDDSRLSEYGIGHGTMLNLVILTPFKIHVQGRDGRMYTVVVPSSKPEMYSVTSLRGLVESAVGYSLSEYQLHHQGKPVDESRHGRDMLLRDHAIKSGSTLVMTKMGLVLNVTNPKVDVCFLVDCTGSMSSHIEAVKNNIQQLRDRLVQEYKKSDLVFAFVRYTDYDQPADSRTTYLPFTNDPSTFQSFVSGIRADGGDDGPEDIMGGLQVALNSLSWRSDSCKIVIHIADCPCHGTCYHTLSGDKYPSGDPAGISHESMMERVAALDIQFWFGYINKQYTDQMIGIFNDSLRMKSKQRLLIRQFDAIDAEEVGEAVESSVISSVYGDAALKVAEIRDFSLDTSVPDWNSPSIPTLTATKTPPPPIRRLSNLQDGDITLEKPCVNFSFKIAPNPFAKGSVCLVYHASDLVNFRRIVLKRFMHASPARNTLECYMKDLEIRMIATVYAREFCMEKLKPSATPSINFVQMDVLQCSGGVCYMMEPFLTGTIQKFNNNDGMVAKSSPHSDLLQAFSHYSWVKSGKTLLICDLEGYKESSQNKITLTDPAIHSSGEGGRYGPMDCGMKGVRKFFNTHTCTDVCRMMRLAGQTV